MQRQIDAIVTHNSWSVPPTTGNSHRSLFRETFHKTRRRRKCYAFWRNPKLTVTIASHSVYVATACNKSRMILSAWNLMNHYIKAAKSWRWVGFSYSNWRILCYCYIKNDISPVFFPANPICPLLSAFSKKWFRNKASYIIFTAPSKYFSVCVFFLLSLTH